MSATVTKLEGLHIEGRRWFQRGPGNTYHSVRIFAGGKQIAHLPYQYGYGEGFLQTALDWLREQGLIESGCSRCDRPKEAHTSREHSYMPSYGTLYLREVLGGTYSVIDVERKKDL